jgi:endonuclease YncB( thermonuclease family)
MAYYAIRFCWFVFRVIFKVRLARALIRLITRGGAPPVPRPRGSVLGWGGGQNTSQNVITLPAGVVEAVVLQVFDGDTFDALTDFGTIRVRLWGMDAPESDQPYGDQAKELLQRTVANRRVVLEQTDTDPYGRLVCRVGIDGFDVSQMMVRSGFAWAYEAYNNRRDTAGYQKEAQLSRRGLWMDESPIPPWEWRKAHPKAFCN